LRHLLNSPTYAGYLSWHHRKDKRDRGETDEQVQGSWEPLWPDALWERIQAVRQRQFRGSNGGRAVHVYPFKGIAKCERCDRRLIGEPHRNKRYMACPTQRERHECEQKGVQSSVMEDQVGEWLASLRIPDDWKADVDRLADMVRRPEDQKPKDTASIEGQMRRLGELYFDGFITREEFVGRRRALEASLTGGPDQPSYDEQVLATAKRLIGDWSELWSKATPKQRADIVSAAFDEVRVKDKVIVSATLARPEYVALVATSEAARDGLSWRPRTDSNRRRAP
jgi:hypothetical protein